MSAFLTGKSRYQRGSVRDATREKIVVRGRHILLCIYTCMFCFFLLLFFAFWSLKITYEINNYNKRMKQPDFFPVGHFHPSIPPPPPPYFHLNLSLRPLFRAKSPFFGEHFLEELLVGDNANNEEEAATALLSASSPHCGAAEEDHDRVTSAVDATPAARSSFLAVEEDKEQQQLQEPQHQQEQQQQHSTPVSPANQCLEFEYRDIGSAGNSGYPDAAAAETGGTAQTASNRLSNSTSASNSLAFPFGSLACGSITPSSSEIGVFGDGGSGTSGGSSVHSGLTDGVCFAKVGDIFEGIGDGGGSGGLAVAESFPVDDAAAAGAAADSPRQLGLFSYPTAAGGENAVPIDKTVPIEKTDEIDKTNEIDETATDEAGPPLSRLLQQQIGDATPTAHDGLIGGAIDGGCKANAVVGASLGGDVEGGPLGEDWLSYDDVPGGIAAGAGEQGEDDGLSGVEADDGADAMDVIFAFEDHFGML